MRALSIPQPWAELVIRGVKTVEVRSWSAKHNGGRIAIHASANIDFKKVEALWADDRAVAQCFADQGWIDRDDLRALPRSAILGSVELRGVHSAQAVRAAKVDPSAANWIDDALETAVRDTETGRLRPGPAPARTIPVAIPPHGFVFGFAKALAVEPILGVEGQQHLWALSADLVAELAACEARARSGMWRRPEPSPERVRAARDSWRERFESEEVRYAMRLIRDALDEAANDAMTLEDEGAERMLRQAMQRLVDERGTRDADGRVLVRVPRSIRPLFSGADRVPAARFEADVRMLLHRARHQQQEQAAYAKLFEDAVARLRESRVRAEESPSSRAEIETEVKRAFKREWLEAEDALERTQGTFHFPDY